MLRIINTLVSEKIKDENEIKLLNKLALQGDDILFAALDVFESDRDETEFLDTIGRIIRIHMKKEQLLSS